MNLKISTLVMGHHHNVMKGFTRDLFERLTPPGVKVDLVRFDGSETGDVVHLQLKMPFFPPQNWISEITNHGSNETRSWFVDTGTVLPWFLGAWEHHHRVEQHGPNCLIIDDINFRAASWIPDVLLYPILWIQFAGRRSVYRQYFGFPSSTD